MPDNVVSFKRRPDAGKEDVVYGQTWSDYRWTVDTSKVPNVLTGSSPLGASLKGHQIGGLYRLNGVD